MSQHSRVSTASAQKMQAVRSVGKDRLEKKKDRLEKKKVATYMYSILTSANSIREVVGIWSNKLGVDSAGHVVLPEHQLWGRIGAAPSDGDFPKFMSAFRRQEAPKPNSVYIDIPCQGFDRNVLGAVAADGDGLRWIIRQGFLRRNGEFGEVGKLEFPRLSTLSPVDID